MNRRDLLAIGGASAVVGLSGCIDEIRDADPDTTDDEDTDTTGDDTTDDEELRPAEEVCPDPPDDLTEIGYERWTTPTHSPTTNSPPLLEDGYRSDGSPGPEEKRVSIITEETKDRLNPERLDGSSYLSGPRDTDDPSFIEETDFETSVLLTFEWEWMGDEDLAVETIGLEDDETVHVYCCRYGDPYGPVRGKEGNGGEPPGGSAITFFRVELLPTTAKVTYSFRLTSVDAPTETETYVADVEVETS